MHIIPLDEDEWFRSNDMYRYVFDPTRQNQSAMSDVNNLMLLRADIHKSFNTEQKFVFCPKKPEPNASNMVVHLTSYSEEYAWLYHNTISYSLDSISREYLFARFAWAILPKVEPFLLRNVERLLITMTKGQHVAGPDDCKGFTVPRSKRSGTGSPKKRQRLAQSSENHDREVEQLVEGVQDGRCSKRAKTIPAQLASHSKLPISVPPSVSSSSTKVHDPSDPTNLLIPEQKHFFQSQRAGLGKGARKVRPTRPVAGAKEVGNGYPDA